MNILVHVVLAFITLVAVAAFIVAGVDVWREEHQ